MTIRIGSPSVLTAALLAAACSGGDDASPGALAAGVVVTGNCDDWGCGKNTWVSGAEIPFHEVDKFGSPNDAGVSIVGFSQAGTSLTIEVHADDFRGETPTGILLSGDDLVGAELALDYDGVPATLVITAAGVTHFWVGDPDEVPVYTFDLEVGDDVDRLCPGLSGGAEEAAQYGGEHTAIVFQGDRYDGVHKIVTATGAEVDGWFNIACAGTAISKSHLLRHTAAGSDATHSTTVAERTAMLKLITADYCGTGTSFTKAGVPIGIFDDEGWFDLELDDMDSIEAIWTENGAMCLTEPRLEGEEPTLWDDIAEECRLPPTCRSYVGRWETHGHLLSANPP